MKRNRRAAIGALALAALLMLGTPASASPVMWELFPSLKACQKGRSVAISNGYWTYVGSCQKTKPAGTYILYMSRA